MATTTLPRRSVSVSLPADLAEELDGWAAADGTNRSSVVVEALRAERRRRCEAELEQDVRDAVAEGFFDDVEFYFPAGAEVILAEPWEPEAG